MVTNSHAIEVTLKNANQLRTSHRLNQFGLLASLLILVEISCVPAPAPIQPPQHRFESAIQKFEQMDRGNPLTPGVILFLGSSSIHGWHTLEDDFSRYRVINRGFGGSELADVLYFFDRVVAPYHPRQILLYEGDNDIAGGKTPEKILADFITFVDRVRRKLPRTPIVFISIKPSASRKHFISAMAEANQLIRQYCGKQPGLTYVDVFHPMLDQQAYPRADIFGADSLHLNAAGYDLWQSIIEPFLLPEQP